MEKYEINGKNISIKPHIFEGKKSFEEYEQQIYSALKKIGITQNYIQISTDSLSVTLSWNINGETFAFTSTKQETKTKNMGAVAQALQEDVRQILRGIKTLDLVMKQYDTDEVIEKPSNLLDYESIELEDTSFSQRNYPKTFSSKIEAQETIKQIKEKYTNFTKPEYLPDDVRESLREAYLYLGVVVKF